MKFRYLVTITVPDGQGDDSLVDLNLLGRILDEAATEMDRPLGSEIETQALPPLNCSMCRGFGFRISDPCFDCQQNIEKRSRELPKLARRWLKWNDLLPRAHPLQVVVWAVEAGFAVFGFVTLLKTLGT